MSDHVRPQDLLEWCRVPAQELPSQPAGFPLTPST